jgi:hypothetical protein
MRPLLRDLTSLRKEIIAKRKELEHLVEQYSTFTRMAVLAAAKGATAGHSGAPLDLPRMGLLDPPWTFSQDLPELEAHAHLRPDGKLDWPWILSRAPRVFRGRDLARQYGLPLTTTQCALWYHLHRGCLKRIKPDVYERVGRSRQPRAVDLAKTRVLAAVLPTQAESNGGTH